VSGLPIGTQVSSTQRGALARSSPSAVGSMQCVVLWWFSLSPFALNNECHAANEVAWSSRGYCSN